MEEDTAKKKKKKKVQITKKNIRTDVSGEVFGPWRVLQYLHHYGTSPIWECECIYCGEHWEASLPRIKRKRECECEDRLKWTSGVFISNNIYKEYVSKAASEDEAWRLSYIDLYKIYNRMGGKDINGEDLVFDYHWNYHNNPPTCNYIWPDLERYQKAIGYTLDNCYFVTNLEQRYPRRRATQLKKVLG